MTDQHAEGAVPQDGCNKTNRRLAGESKAGLAALPKSVRLGKDMKGDIESRILFQPARTL